MKKFKKIMLLLMTLTLLVSALLVEFPIRTHASISFDTTNGIFVINSLQNDFKDGKYRIRYTFEYNNVPVSVYRVTLTNIRLENSSGNSVIKWNDIEMLEGGGSIDKNFYVDFSNMPSDTYYFKFTVEPYYAKDKAQSFKRKIEHSAGTITYSKSSYSTDTVGDTYLTVHFNFKMLKGKNPKLEIYDSNQKLVYSYCSNKSLSCDNCDFHWRWNMQNSSTGLPVSPGSYTFKASCGGKSCIKNLNIN